MGQTAQAGSPVPTEAERQTAHLKLLPELLVAFASFRRHGHIEVLALLLAQQLKPKGRQGQDKSHDSTQQDPIGRTRAGKA